METLPSGIWGCWGRTQATGSVATRPDPYLAARVPWQMQRISSWGHVESASPVQRATARRRVNAWGVGRASALLFTGLLPSQGDQDDRSCKQCRTSSPSSTGSVSLGRYTPTSRSPQHYSRPGT